MPLAGRIAVQALTGDADAGRCIHPDQGTPRMGQRLGRIQGHVGSATGNHCFQGRPSLMVYFPRLFQGHAIGIRELQRDGRIAGKFHRIQCCSQPSVSKGRFTVGRLRAPADQASAIIDRGHQVCRKQPRASRGTDVEVVPGIVDARGAVQQLSVRSLQPQGTRPPEPCTDQIGASPRPFEVFETKTRPLPR